jgi:inosine/xanthosine triphosphate pyrophosphatase family protein
MAVAVPRRTVVYVTSSQYKREESDILVQQCKFADGVSVSDEFEFDYRVVSIQETLEVDLERIVKEEVQKAYAQIKVPCIVEHAGLIFQDFLTQSYPGGLTKAMWNALEGRFVQETNSGGRLAIARAVIAYCDGMTVRTFVGETQGKIADHPKGKREFYWDTVFIPYEPGVCELGKTYAEIVDTPGMGVAFKVTNLSQSTRAMLKLLEFLRNNSHTELWR